MKVKIIGFKTGELRPVFNRTLTIDVPLDIPNDVSDELGEVIEDLGEAMQMALTKSDYISVRRILEGK